MPITGRFEADFASFQTAVSDAELKLRSFEQGGAKVEQQLNRVADSLSGRKLIADATLAAAAVEKLGGTSKLTAAELQKLGNTATEAIAKMRAIGIEVPPGIRKIADEAAAAERSVGLLGGTFGQLVGAFSAASLITRAATALTGFATEALASAGALVDLSNKSGLSTETLQRMQFVAKQSGSDVGTFADAVFKMGVNVAEGTGKARKGAEDLGLSWKALRAAAPDDQFNMVVQALERMEDPQRRNEAAVALFGKTAKDILPAIVDGYSKVAAQATVAGNAQVHALDEAGDAWDRFKTRTQTAFTQGVGSAILLHEAVATLTADQRQFILDTDKSIKTTDDFSAALIRAAAARKDMGKDVNLTLPKPVPPEFIDELKAAQVAYQALTVEQRENLRAGIELGKSNDDIVNGLGITEATLALVKKAWQEEATASTKALADEKKNLDERNKGFIQSAALQTKLIDEITTNQRKAGATADELQQIALDNQMAAEIAAARANTKVTQQEIDTSVALIKIKYKGLSDDIGLDYQAIAGSSLKSAGMQRDDAFKLYTYMAEHANQYTREALQAQLDKYRELTVAATASGRAMVEGEDRATDATKRHTDAIRQQLDIVQAAIAAQGQNEQSTLFGSGPLDDRNKTVQTLGGEWITPAEAKKRFDSGGDVDYNNPDALKRPPMSVEDYIRAFGNNIQAGAAAYNADQAARARARAALATPALSSSTGIPFNSGRGDTHVTVPVSVSGVWDPATARQLGEVVSQVVMGKLSFGTQFGPR